MGGRLGRRGGRRGVGQPVLDRVAARTDRLRRPGATIAADPVGREGKPDRSPAAGIRHRHPERRPRPVVFARHRPRAGSGQRDRARSRGKTPPGVRRRPAQPAVKCTGTASGFAGSAAGRRCACDDGRRPYGKAARRCRASAGACCAGHQPRRPTNEGRQSAGRDAGNAADAVQIDDGAAGSCGDKTDRARTAARSHHRAPVPEVMAAAPTASDPASVESGSRNRRASAPNSASISAAPTRSTACARCGAVCSSRTQRADGACGRSSS